MIEERKNKVLILRAPESTHNRIAQEANRLGRIYKRTFNMSEVVRHIVDEYFENMPPESTHIE